MENLNEFFEKAKTNRKAFASLKNAAIACQDFQTAADLREMEKQLFPETEEEKEVKNVCTQSRALLNLLKFERVSDRTAWVLYTGFEIYFKSKGDQTSLHDAAGVLAKAHHLFNEEE